MSAPARPRWWARALQYLGRRAAHQPQVTDEEVRAAWDEFERALAEAFKDERREVRRMALRGRARRGALALPPAPREVEREWERLVEFIRAGRAHGLLDPSEPVEVVAGQAWAGGVRIPESWEGCEHAGSRGYDDQPRPAAPQPIPSSFVIERGALVKGAPKDSAGHEAVRIWVNSNGALCVRVDTSARLAYGVATEDLPRMQEGLHRVREVVDTMLAGLRSAGS